MKFKIPPSLLVALCAMLVGCGKWPPVVSSAREVRKVSVKEPAVRARGLPDAELSSLAHLTNLEHLDFHSGWAGGESSITDEGLKTLSKIPFTRLRVLSLGHCNRITDDGLVHLKNLKSVRWLSLMACKKITDEGLANLVPVSTLGGLDLRGCPHITDEGLMHLARMKNLGRVWLGGCPKVTPEGIQRLRKGLVLHAEPQSSGMNGVTH